MSVRYVTNIAKTTTLVEEDGAHKRSNSKRQNVAETESKCIAMLKMFLVP
jgi:hypothetical protein